MEMRLPWLDLFGKSVDVTRFGELSVACLVSTKCIDILYTFGAPGPVYEV